MVTEKLLNMATRIQEAPYFNEQKHMKPFVNILYCLNKANILSVENKQSYEYLQARAMVSQRTRKLKPSVREYIMQNESQLELNRTFHDFVSNLIASYKNDPDCPKYESEHGLPLGKEFQLHVAAFLEFQEYHSLLTFSLPNLPLWS